MNNELAIFKNDEFGNIELILDENGEPLFELYSVGQALGYVKIDIKNGKEYIRVREDRIDIIVKNADILPFYHDGRKFLNEDMLYDFIFEAKTKKSKPFRKWVTSEVLPTLRKTGKYELHNDKEEDEKEMISQTELEQIATNIFGDLNTKIDKLDEYYRPKHKTKLNLNKFIKNCLGDNATTENCKKAKNTLLTMLGNYTIYEEVPLDKLRDTKTLATLYDICKNINLSILGGIQ